jgi:hypothetical protein
MGRDTAGRFHVKTRDSIRRVPTVDAGVVGRAVCRVYRDIEALRSPAFLAWRGRTPARNMPGQALR